MALELDEIKSIAHLARLNVPESELEIVKDQLTNILELVQKMNKADTSNIAPLANPLNETQPLRPDEVTETNQRENFQAIAPEIQDGLYIVPQVIEQE